VPTRNLLNVQRYRLGRRAFSVAGPTAWNSLPDPVRNPNATEAAFCWKRFCSHGTAWPHITFRNL